MTQLLNYGCCGVTRQQLSILQLFSHYFLGRMRERIGNKIELLSWNKNYSLKQKKKIKVNKKWKGNDNNIYYILYRCDVCIYTYILMQWNYLPADAQPPPANCPQYYGFLHGVMWYTVTLDIIQANSPFKEVLVRRCFDSLWMSLSLFRTEA